MANPNRPGTMFNQGYNIFAPLVSRESVVNFQRKLDEKKKAPLASFINIHQNLKDKLELQLKKIVKVEHERAKLEKALNTCVDEKQIQLFKTEIKECDDYITDSRDEIAPYIEVLEALAQKIQAIEAQIEKLEQSAISIESPAPK